MSILSRRGRRKVGHLADIRVRHGRPGWQTAAVSVDSGLPPELTSFVGRETELRTIAGAVTSARLVTIAGPGGCGKTRLAARTAAGLAARWPDGARWVDLTATSDPAAVVSTVAGSLDLLRAEDGIASLTQALRARRLLLCFDNCEHVLDAAADIVGELLRRCPDVSVLATSREPLRIPGETVLRVPPLSVADSVELFLARAGGDPAAVPGEVRAACVRLEGMPLAIELAAAWAGTLSPGEILRGLDDRFRLLVRGPHGVAERHQTLAASMDWSHDLLATEDQALFARLAVFPGGFTAAAAQAIGDLGDNVLDGLRRLIDKSLVIADFRPDGTRYRMLEAVREYAAARLAASGDGDIARDRQLDACLAHLESVRHLQATDMDAWRAVVAADHENVLAAARWGLALDDPERGRRLVAELPWFWHLGRDGREGMDLLSRAIGLSVDERTALQARLLTGLALVANTTTPLALDDPARAGMEIATEVGDGHTACLAMSLRAIGMLGADFSSAWDIAGRAAALAREVGNGFVHDGANVVRGIVCHLRDDHEQAIELLGAAVPGLIGRNDRGVAATALAVLAISRAVTGDLPGAMTTAREAVLAATPLGDYHRVGTAHSVLAHVLGLAGRSDEAWAAMRPVLELIDGAESPPFVPELTLRIAYLHLSDGRPDLALAAFDGITPDLLTPRSHVVLAAALLGAGDLVAAGEQAEAALEMGRELGMAELTADALEVLARLAADTDPQRAMTLHHEALVLRAERGLLLSCVDSLEEIAALSGSAVVHTACRSARERFGYPAREPLPDPPSDPDGPGSAMSLDEAVAYVRRSRGVRARPSIGWASLTPTERGVVDLAAEGLTNPEIGGRLFMSRATVKTHLSRVYAKLGVANRTQLAAARPTTDAANGRQ